MLTEVESQVEELQLQQLLSELHLEQLGIMRSEIESLKKSPTAASMTAAHAKLDRLRPALSRVQDKVAALREQVESQEAEGAASGAATDEAEELSAARNDGKRE